MTFYSMTTYLYHMNNELSITNKENNLDKSALARVINGKQKHTVGWKLE